MRRCAIISALAALALCGELAYCGPIPIVIGHRGASGYRPEHTLAAYELAIQLGANYIEPDLVMTKDGVLVARHENAIAIVRPDGTIQDDNTTTNVHTLPQFANRKATKMIDGASITGWFTEDFTLAELKTLKARERLPALRPGGAAFDDMFEVPTLQEVINLSKTKSTELGRTIGIYPETKHPSYFDSIGLSMEDPLVSILHASYGNSSDAPVFIQSFEVGNLVELNGKTNVRIAQLLNAGGRPWDFTVSGDSRTYADLATPIGLNFINDYADGIGVNKNLIIPRNLDGTLGTPTSLVNDAHAAGLDVHGWTFRAENNFLPTEFRVGANPAAAGNGAGEIVAFLQQGMDGFFTDQPDVGVAAVAQVPEPSTIGLISVCAAIALVLFLRRRRAGQFALAILVVAAFAHDHANAQPFPTLDGSNPLVIGHRGASGYLPEHTLESYELAIQQGANFIEPDLVSTKDGHLIARHEPMLVSNARSEYQSFYALGVDGVFSDFPDTAVSAIPEPATCYLLVAALPILVCGYRATRHRAAAAR